MTERRLPSDHVTERHLRSEHEIDPHDFTGAVVVGLGDGNGGGTERGADLPLQNWPELEWAAHEAALRRRPLHVIRAFQVAPSSWPWDNAIDHAINAELQERARMRVAAAMRALAAALPELVPHSHVPAGDPRTVLRGAAETAELVVVGSRKLGAFGGAVLGSVSSAVAGHDACPTVVVGSPPGLDGENPSIIAGVDGSPVTEDVLSFAFDFASRHRRPLRVVFCWRRDMLADMQWRVAPPIPERAERWLAEAVAGWLAKYPDVELHRAVIRDHPVEGLVRDSASQELLVVGARAQRGRFASMLGSVSQGVLHHATCPVAVVHPSEGA